MTDLHYSPVNSVHPQGCLQFQCLPEGVVPYQSALMSVQASISKSSSSRVEGVETVQGRDLLNHGASILRITATMPASPNTSMTNLGLLGPTVTSFGSSQLAQHKATNADTFINCIFVNSLDSQTVREPTVQHGKSPTCPSCLTNLVPLACTCPYPSKPFLSPYLSKCLLNVVIVLTSITSSGRLFHTHITLRALYSVWRTVLQETRCQAGQGAEKIDKKVARTQGPELQGKG